MIVLPIDIHIFWEILIIYLGCHNSNMCTVNTSNDTWKFIFLVEAKKFQTRLERNCNTFRLLATLISINCRKINLLIKLGSPTSHRNSFGLKLEENCTLMEMPFLPQDVHTKESDSLLWSYLSMWVSSKLSSTNHFWQLVRSWISYLVFYLVRSASLCSRFCGNFI